MALNKAEDMSAVSAITEKTPHLGICKVLRMQALFAHDCGVGAQLSLYTHCLCKTVRQNGMT